MYLKLRPKEKYFDYATSAMLKLDDLSAYLKDWERSMCISVANEKLSELDSSVKVTDAYSLLNISASDRKILEEIDLAKIVLIKLGEGKARSQMGHDFSSFYVDGYLALQKLTKCEMIYISKSFDNKVYKIGFVHDGKEVSVYDMRHKVDIGDIQFYTLNDDPISYGKRYFSVVTDKSGALSILKGENYPDDQLHFFSRLLAQ